MSHSPQQVRFCTSRDGVRIAYATSGQGPPLVRAAGLITHLEYDWDSPIWHPWLSALSRHNTLVRYDARGSGLSDRERVAFTFDRYLEDLEAVIAAADLGRVALFGIGGGGALAVAFAALHPQKVSHLVLYGAFTRGALARAASSERVDEIETTFRLAELGFAKDDPSSRHLFAAQFLPDATAEQLQAFGNLLRVASSPGTVPRFLRPFYTADIRDLAQRVKCPALVLHPRVGFRVPFDEGRMLATLIPGARLVPLASRNQMALEQEAVWQRVIAEIDEFLLHFERSSDRVQLPFDQLTSRERDILECIAQGLDNRSIAKRLGIREKIATTFRDCSVNLASTAAPGSSCSRVRLASAKCSEGPEKSWDQLNSVRRGGNLVISGLVQKT